MQSGSWQHLGLRGWRTRNEFRGVRLVGAIGVAPRAQQADDLLLAELVAGVERQDVTVGAMNTHEAVITFGLQEGVTVARNAGR